ncbi:SIS domain-containing protein [Alkaliphilus peptidifermentans]|uniref:Fructoselysine 6-phosphate deglycase n=1 Tax=Alkaliphilus peptidifermentans DSM 18978 TaxID=1120976 RepID=A0A1G5HRD2_9FIRM|nr:SIS domain-containing protein [Alkaliphilus peptidifermentans]SCY66313.1 fructoselysine 6-phosphate deglycase [Alkaliphilus peptidifermentans DSM 18978]
MNNEHIKQLGDAIKSVKSGEVKNFYFVACGGSMALLYPAHYIYDREIDIPAAIYSSNEFIHRAPKALGKGSVVILCSHSGNTPETVKAAEFARGKGAITIAFSNLVDSPLWKAAEYPIHYDWGQDADAAEENNGMLYRLIFGILEEVISNEKYGRALKNVDNLQKIYKYNKEATAEAADEFGKKYKREKLIYTLASGPNYGVAYSFTSCLLMEMLWINSNAIHAGEFFHGPFEITDYDVPFIVIKGLGETRPIDDRAHVFAEKFSEKVEVIDAATFNMEGIDEDLRGYFAPLVAGVILRQYADRIAEHTGHPLSVRRYMWKMEY